MVFLTKDHILHEGDIVSLDAGLIYKGYHSDMARTFPVGQVSEEARLLMEGPKEAFAGIERWQRQAIICMISPMPLMPISDPFGYGIVKDLVGHGIGTSLHEDPQIPLRLQHRRGLKLQAGMTVSIEPHDQYRKTGCGMAGRRLDSCHRGWIPVRTL